jgi:hypothetical protein
VAPVPGFVADARVSRSNPLSEGKDKEIHCGISDIRKIHLPKVLDCVYTGLGKTHDAALLHVLFSDPVRRKTRSRSKRVERVVSESAP